MVALLPLLGAGQQNMGPGRHRTAAAASSSCPFSDGFSGSGALSATWTAMSGSYFTGTIQQNSGVAQASGSYTIGGAEVSGSSCAFGSTQFAAWTVTASAGSSTLLLGIETSSSGAGIFIRSGAIELSSGNGNYTYEKGCNAGVYTVGNQVEIAVTANTGTTETAEAWYNAGGGWTDAGCTVTITTTQSGNPGMILYPAGAANSTRVSSFSAGPYTAAP